MAQLLWKTPGWPFRNKLSAHLSDDPSCPRPGPCPGETEARVHIKTCTHTFVCWHRLWGPETLKTVGVHTVSAQYVGGPQLCLLGSSLLLEGRFPTPAAPLSLRSRKSALPPNNRGIWGHDLAAWSSGSPHLTWRVEALGSGKLWDSVAFRGPVSHCLPGALV